MPYQTNNDNIYSVGTLIFAKEAPTVQLQIKHYYQRIYYCGIVGSESAKNKVFVERELIAPGQPSNAYITQGLFACHHRELSGGANR